MRIAIYRTYNDKKVRSIQVIANKADESIIQRLQSIVGGPTTASMKETKQSRETIIISGEEKNKHPFDPIILTKFGFMLSSRLSNGTLNPLKRTVKESSRLHSNVKECGDPVDAIDE